MTTLARLINETTSLCRTCKQAIPARVVADERNEVWMHKRCDEHGPQSARLSTNAEWYERTRAIQPKSAPPTRETRPIDKGCPFDCGPCESHAQRIRMPVVTITSACDLDCPICYVHNKNESPFHMSRDEFGRVLDTLVRESGEFDLINLTGGEPLLHPDLLALIEMAHERGIHRVSVCSNGVRLAKDEALVEKLAKLDARIALSFDTFDKHTDRAMQGAALVDMKHKVLSLLDRHGVDTTLIPVMSRGYNDHEIGDIIKMGLELSCVRHLEVHTITYTGQGGASFDRSARISMFEVLEAIEKTTGGMLRTSDFVPSPSAHPLCYQIAYLLTDDDGGAPLSFLRFMERDELYACLEDHLYLEPTARLEAALQDSIDRVWARGDDADSTRALKMLDRLVRTLFPAEKPLDAKTSLRVGERAAKAVYVHSHMDEDTFDTERAYLCCDSNCYADGRTVPVCNYNVLYRDKEPRFVNEPRAWGARSGGQRSLPIVTDGRRS